jgi:hypothetical protein
MHHYRLYTLWLWDTNAERIVNTIAWLPTSIIMNFDSTADAAIAAAIYLVRALCQPSPSSIQHGQLQQLEDIFHKHTQAHPTIIPSSAHAQFQGWCHI